MRLRIFEGFTQYVRHPRRLISSRVLLYAIGALAIFFAYQTAQVVLKRHETERDIKEFEAQVAELEGTQGRLAELNQFLSTDFFAEKEARIKLGMQKAGEEVVIIQEPTTNTSTGMSQGVAVEEPERGVRQTNEEGKPVIVVEKEDVQKQKSNPEKWWDYFFAQDGKE